ncbi:MAG: hypothetical protein PWQ79_1605 [Thermococcaceae archaeon]|nr:hypothetical protein [Thermococcaceae archaeon]MDK2914690.1 hypothetical protein [Thermococcaceae archaeon]
MEDKTLRGLSILSAITGVLILLTELMIILYARYSLPPLSAENEGRYVGFGLLLVIFLLYLPVPLSFFLLAGLLYPGEIKYLKALRPLLTPLGLISVGISLLMLLRADIVGFLSFLTLSILAISLARKEELHKSERFKTMAQALAALCVLQAALFGALILSSV